MPSDSAVQAVEDLARYARAHALEDADAVLVEIMAMLLRPSRWRVVMRLKKRYPVAARPSTGVPATTRVSIERLRRHRRARAQSGQLPSAFNTSPAK